MSERITPQSCGSLRPAANAGVMDLSVGANGHAGNDAVLLELVVNKADDRLRNGEAKALAASARRNNEGVNTHQVAVPVDQRAAAVARD